MASCSSRFESTPLSICRERRKHKLVAPPVDDNGLAFDACVRPNRRTTHAHISFLGHSNAKVYFRSYEAELFRIVL